MSELSNQNYEYIHFLSEVKERIRHSQYKALKSVMIEMGAWFTFVGNQFRLEVGANEYYIDLLLFHRKLRRLVALELKIGEFKPEYKGKMEFYLNVLNEHYKEEGENDAIGIIVCKSKDKTVVEYSLKTTMQPIGVATYSTSPSLPAEYSQYLPTPEVIAERLAMVKVLFDDESEIG